MIIIHPSLASASLSRPNVLDRPSISTSLRLALWVQKEEHCSTQKYTGPV